MLRKLLLCSGVLLAACGQQEDGPEKLKIGYVINFMSHEWYQNISKSAVERAEELGVELIVADANLDVAAQISKAENLLVQGVKVLILSPVDAKALGPLVRQAKEAGVKVITEANPVRGADTYVGIDNRASGVKVGKWFAGYAKEKGIDPKILVIGLPNFEDCRQRVDGFKAALAESGIAYEIVQEVDGQGLKEKAFKVAQDALTAHPDINVIYGINDDSTTGGMAAYKAAGLDEGALTGVGFGFEGTVGQTALTGDTPYEGALAMFPNYVGRALIDAAIKLANGEQLPAHYETPTIVVTRDNIDRFYDRSTEPPFAMKVEAVRALMP
jgi:ABC-type sugar transport system substrate-binding protein